MIRPIFMRRLFTILCTIATILAVSCTEEVGNIAITQLPYEIGAEGGNGYVMLNSTHKWNAICRASWVTLTISEGNSGSGKLTFTVKANKETTSRRATILLSNTAQGSDTEFVIVQSAFIPEFEMTANTISFNSAGGSQEVNITANFDFETECEQEWIECEKTATGVSITAEAHQQTQSREAEIVISNEKYGIAEKIIVTQEAFEPILDIAQTEFMVKGKGDIINVEVSANIEFEVKNNTDWITHSITDKGLQLIVSQSLLNKDRSAKITISNKEYDLSQEITVTQEIGVNAPIEILNADFEQGLQGWTINKYSNGNNTTVTIADGEGVNGSKAVKISQAAANGKCSVAVERKLSGLEPDKMYRLSARMRYSNIASGCGAVLFSPNSDQYWNASQWTSGTSNTWTTAIVDFLADDDGKATISCALGFWLGGVAGGGYATGTVYYDNITVTRVTSKEMYMRESEHMRIYFDGNKTSVTDTATDVWLKKVDEMYEAYEDLVGAVPHEGRKLAILTTYGMYSGYWALAGYPILWNTRHGDMNETINEATTRNTISFGLMHELGHVFNVNYTYNGKRYYSNWDWNDEMFANFRMQYGLEMTANAVYQKGNGDSSQKVYRGREILNMYKQDYDMTLPKGKLNDNAIHYLLARLADENIIGWEPFRRTFREITTKSCPYSNNYDKFTYFVNTLSKHATEVHGKKYDLLNDPECFSEEDIAAIKAQLK